MAQLAADPCRDVTVSMTAEYMQLHRSLTPQKEWGKISKGPLRCVSGVQGVAPFGGTGLPMTGAEREVTERHTPSHTPSIAFRHLSPAGARMSFTNQSLEFAGETASHAF